MEMGNEEIKSSYRNAKQKKKQIGILADLNCCSREEIKKIVQEAEKGSPDNDIIHRLYGRIDILDREIRERESHKQLLETAKAHKGPVLISGYESNLYNDMLQGWHREENTCYSQICSKKQEVLWMNFEPMGQMSIEDIPGVMP